ncbi:TPA: RNA chaperone Hfq [Escherichia coli]|nr:RNA chaperone Hfq [Escherichia coli]HCJ8610327.1 RNA chaperone Hfq [Escherichia coli]
MHYQNDLPERERLAQIEEARRLAKQDRHIDIPGKGKNGGGGSKLKGHEALVDALKANKTKCEFTFLDNEKLTGTIEHFDALTISVKHDESAPRVVFKTSLKYFTPLKKA